MADHPGRPSPIETAAADPLWHAMSAEQVLQALEVRPQGLSDEEAAARLARDGANRLPAPPRPHPLLRFLAQFNNALIYFLLSAALASAVLGHVVDALVIVVVVLINAVVGFLQEGKAEQALDAIRDMISPHAVVLRGGERRRIDAADMVPGDIVLMEAGDKVPADVRLLRARALQVDEAVLTGESLPATKREEAVAAEAALGDRHGMMYSGTLVATGQAMGVVVATGARTQIGHISGLIGSVQTLTTPLLAQINRFGTRFTWVAASVAALLFVFAIGIRDYDWVEALMVVVALAVGVVPEGLPAVITITLSIGVRRMAARNAVVRRLPAVETLGATSVICSDKTGTLTRNEMTARRVLTGIGETSVEGAGYAPEGGLSAGGGEEVRAWLLRSALLCNDARLAEEGGQWRVLGDPMEGALVTLALKAGLDAGAERAAWGRRDEIPFDAQHRYMATLHDAPWGGRVVFVKGAPERVLEMCAAQAGEGGEVPLDRAYWEQGIARAASGGERVLGFAMRLAGEDVDGLEMGDVADGLVFLGLVGFIDPPRDEAIAAVAACRSAGMAVKMITGDHAGTAIAIARQLALADQPEAMTGAEVDALSDEDLRAAVGRVSVFARTSPEHKLRIVRALQANGHVVAMTGDGVNDAPSLKQADVGIAMGRKGTEAAKEAAEMVLLDDNFASIAAAVHEGRTVYDNIRKVIAWTLPTNGGEALCVMIALLAGLALPMTPVQILWINMILTVTLGLVLAFEPAEPGVMARPPRARAAPLLSPFLLWRIGFVSALFAAGVFGVFEYTIRRGGSEEAARTMVVNALVVMEIFYLFNVRYLHATSFSLRGAAGTPAVLASIAVVLGAQALFTYAPFMQAWFGSESLSWRDALVVGAVGLAVMVVLELEKSLMRRWRE